MPEISKKKPNKNQEKYQDITWINPGIWYYKKANTTKRVICIFSLQATHQLKTANKPLQLEITCYECGKEAKETNRGQNKYV